ncbi:patellin-4-like [Aristolochia californica]|uniref:patellin-4-like n=1 Tax=Aristolochia californica TaxID=171875 RepID=UPI0035D6E9B6
MVADNDSFPLEEEICPGYEDTAAEQSDSAEEIVEPRELTVSEKTALVDLRTLLEDAILSDALFESSNKIASDDAGNNPPHVHRRPDETRENISLWGVPLLPSKGHEETDTVLVKFLRATEFNASEALDMLRKTLKWRRDFRVEGILDEDLGGEFDSMSYINSTDKEGRPICYNMFGLFKDKGLFQKTLGTEEKRDAFVRWRVQCMEKGIRQLSFKKGGPASIIQIVDLNNSTAHGMKELRHATRKAVLLLQDNYPDVILRNIFINVPFRYYIHRAMFSCFLSQSTKTRCIFVRSRKVTETLLKYVAPENIPIQYGGLKRENEDEFLDNEAITEMTIKGGGSHTIEIPIAEAGVTAVWDITVVGWEATYKEEFIPDDDCSYTVLIQKEKKMEESVRNSFYINEPGKVVVTVDNRSFKKKKVLYRSKTKPTVTLYNLLK